MLLQMALFHSFFMTEQYYVSWLWYYYVRGMLLCVCGGEEHLGHPSSIQRHVRNPDQR